MNILTTEKRVAVISALFEGCSIRSTVCLTGAAKDTVLKLLAQVGGACIEYQDSVLRNLPCKRIECDEIWSFCYAKDRNLPEHMRGMPGVGSMWTWTALCADSKLIVSWRLGARDAANAHAFIGDVAERLSRRVQLTTDGNRVYLDAVETHLGGMVDFAQLIKQYGEEPTNPEMRYSPGKCLGAKKRQIDGNPDMSLVSTSYAERQNLTIRMKNRRFTRLTNAFSKKAGNLAYSIALDFMHHNFCRKHQTLKTTPARFDVALASKTREFVRSTNDASNAFLRRFLMVGSKSATSKPARAAGIENRTWTIQDIVELLPAACHKQRF